ncbi:MAG: hypothetical protein EOR39_20320 [Mesorhizobium sp.]|nr:MAG: hypothetical protein EOR39_20320 [Mesorhizobium sp.]
MACARLRSTGNGRAAVCGSSILPVAMALSAERRLWHRWCRRRSKRPRCCVLLPNTKQRSEGASDGARKQSNRSTDRSARRYADAIAALRHPRPARQLARRGGAREPIDARDADAAVRARDRAQGSPPHRDGAEARTLPGREGAAGFYFEAQPSIDPKQIRDLAASRWIANGENVLLLGLPGVGKTHLAIALGERRSWPDIQRSSRRRRRWSLASPRRTASGAWTRNCWRCRNQKLLIVDELGYLPLEPDAAHLFFQLVSRRYETGAMLITSNRSVAEWGTVFADPVVATAILDRLLHHSHVLTIRGDSYRLRAKRNSGLIRPPVGDRPPVGSASQCLRLVGHNCKQHAYQADRDGARPEDHARLPYTPRNPHRLRAPQHAIFSRNAGHVRPRQQALP